MPGPLRYAVNCSILFTELPLLERPAAARAAGFHAVEFWWPFAAAVPTDREADEFVTAVRDAGVQLIALNFFGGDLPAGDRGIASWPGREDEFADNIAALAELGGRLGCRSFNALYGNRIDGVAPELQDELATANLRAAADRLAGFGGTVLLEPISGVPRYPLLTAADVERVVATVGRDNLGLLADLYHLAVNGDDLDAVIDAWAGRPGGVAHVQIADAPGRGEPGSGALPLEQLLAGLARAGYAGWVGLEYRPSGATVDSFSALPPLSR